MKPETEKQFTTALKAFKPIEAYIAQQRKIDQAFAALEEKSTRTHADHKAFLQKAGTLEAKRLLGEVSDTDAQVLDTDLIAVRDQQDRLSAARQALELQKAELDRQARPLYDQAAQTLSNLKRTLEVELDQEVRQAAAMINSAVNRLYAFCHATGMDNLKQGVTDIKIPSLVDGENLFQKPTRYHPIRNTLVEAPWENDKDAKALYDRLQNFGIAYNILRRDERRIDDAERQAERESEQQHVTNDAA